MALAIEFHRFTCNLLGHPSADGMDGLKRSVKSVEESFENSGMMLLESGWAWTKRIKPEVPFVDVELERDEAVVLCQIAGSHGGKFSRIAMKLSSELVNIGGKRTRDGWKFTAN